MIKKSKFGISSDYQIHEPSDAKVLGYIFNDRSSFLSAVLYKFHARSTIVLDILHCASKLIIGVSRGLADGWTSRHVVVVIPGL